MLSFEDAKRRISQLPLPLRMETIPIWDAFGRILAKDIHAVQDLPAWNNSAMDGYAFRREDILGASEQNPITLTLSGIIQAGDASEDSLKPGTCIRIFTGAPVPNGADVVIMQENTTADENTVTITKCPAVWKNIRRHGEEALAGSTIVKKGTHLNAAAIGFALSASVHEVSVFVFPKIGIFSTGDELRNPKVGGTLQTGQIWGTNLINLQIAFQQMGIVVQDCGIARDTIESTQQTLLRAIQDMHCDMLISTGGVSVGDFDVVHKALADLPGHHVEMDFWKVRMKPGKPVAIGTICTPTKNIPIFALPGNPVSALMGFYQFVRPYLLSKMSVPNPELPTVDVELGQDFTKRGSRLEFVRIWLKRDEDSIKAFATGNQSSAWMSSFADATALLPFPAEQTLLTKGSIHRVQCLPRLGSWDPTWRQ